MREDHQTESQAFVLNFDGLCQPKNPGGIATYGVVIKRDGKKVFEDMGLADAKPWSNDASNNVAEYSGLIRGLEWLKENRHIDSPVLIRGDSRLVVNQLKSVYKVKAVRLVELHQRAKDLISGFKQARIEWVDRSLNNEADLLSRIAFARYSKAHPMK